MQLIWAMENLIIGHVHSVAVHESTIEDAVLGDSFPLDRYTVARDTATLCGFL